MEMIDPESPFKTYSDRYCSFEYPSHLTCQRDPYSVGYMLLRQGRKYSGRESVVINVIPSSRTDFDSEIEIRTMKRTVGKEHDDGAVRRRVERSGRCSSVDNAHETLELFTAYMAGFSGFFWMVHIPFERGVVEVKIHADRNFQEDEAMWLRMQKSIRVHCAELAPEDVQPVPPARRSRVSAKVVEALEGLPAELHHLKDSILDLSRQSAGAIGCGDADISVVEEAMEKRIAGLSRDDARLALEDDYERLDEWAHSQKKRSKKAANAAFAVTGVLIGKLTYELQ